MRMELFDESKNIINILCLDIIECNFYEADSTWDYKNVCSPYNRLFFITEGEGYIINEQHKIVLKPGNAYLIPSKSVYTYKCDSSMQKLYLHFNLSLLPGIDIFDNLSKCISLPFSVDKSKNLASNLRTPDLFNSMKSKIEIEEIILRFLNSEILDSRFIDLYSNYIKHRELFNLIRQNVSGDLKIKDIASRLNLSLFSLSRKFKQDFGLSLNDYIENILIKSAKQLLLTSDMQISEISTYMKFCDPYYFSRFFKKHEGISPREYRNKNNFRIR